MLSAVLGLFSQDLAVDLGTSNTRIWMRGAGVVCNEPTVVAVHANAKGRRKVVAFGKDALPMLGRTPTDVRAVKPVKDGRIADYEIAEALLVHLVRRAHGRNSLTRPRMVVTIPFGMSEVETRAIRESCEGAGARDVRLLSRPLAAALGSELPIEHPSGHLVVDVGGGSTEIAVLSMRGVVSGGAVVGGGEAMDEAIVAFLRDHRELLVGRTTAERVKHEIGTANPGAPQRTATVAGRCLRTGVPRAVAITSDQIAHALAPNVEAIAAGIRRVLDATPPELASDVAEHGIVLSGGASGLRALDSVLRDHVGLPVIRVENADGAVVTGAGRALESRALLEAVAT